MTIKNDMEFLVKAEMRKQRELTGKNDDGCWCLLCEMDILALALNQLPPRYCQEKNFCATDSRGFGGDVRNAVARAVQRVGRRPKHRPGRVPSGDTDVRMENYAQKIGHAVLATVLSSESAACPCDQCQADILAYALNRYPPKYGVSYGGRESYQENYADFIRHEIAQALTRAAAVVRERPHHL